MNAREDSGHDAAAYVLGALEAHELVAFRAHLRSCAVCQEEVSALEHVVDALPMSAPQYETPKALRRRVMSAVREEPRRSPATRRPGWPPWLLRLHPGLALAGAAAVTVVAVALGGGGARQRVIQAQVGDAQLRLRGSRAELIVRHLPAPAPGQIYEMWVQHGSAAPAPSTLFSVTSADSADIGVPVGLHRNDRVLVTSEPAGGSRHPSSAPVVVVSRD